MATRIVIIGGGPAGYEAALVGAARNAQVTVIDSDGIGGAAVLFDCVPSKTFIASTGMRTELRRGPHLGFDIDIEAAKISLPEIHQRVKRLAADQSDDVKAQLLSAGCRGGRRKGRAGRHDPWSGDPPRAGHPAPTGASVRTTPTWC